MNLRWRPPEQKLPGVLLEKGVQESGVTVAFWVFTRAWVTQAHEFVKTQKMSA